MKIFTIDEANDLLPEVIPKLASIRNLYRRLDALQEPARAAAQAAGAGGGMAGGTTYVNILYTIGKLTTGLHEIGLELKDHTRGLIDFPSLKGERIIYLCWQFGDGDRIIWWHETNAGFAGRQPF